MALKPHLALLRAVNIGGRKATTADLRAMMADLGLADARTLLQTGNLVFRSKATGAALEVELEAGFEKRFGYRSDVLVRAAAEWKAVLAANPHAEMAERDPSHLVVVALKSAPDAADVAALQGSVQGPEIIAAVGRELFITYPAGIGSSKLTGAVIERRLRTRGTARNWNTATKLAAMLAELG
jgi:uncharacterized protein (DUF1697 family)